MGKGNETQSAANTLSLISAGTELRGEIDCGGDLRIDGTVIGTLRIKSKVVVGETGRIEGDMQCKNADIMGYMQGKLQVVELLSLKATGKFNGELQTQRLGIEPGAVFTGTCKMSEDLTSHISGEKKDK